MWEVEQLVVVAFERGRVNCLLSGLEVVNVRF